MWWARTLACSSLAFGTTMLCGFVMLVAWRLVGCSGKERTITTLYFYHSGTWNLFMSSVALTTASFLMQIENMEVKKAMLILFSFKEIIKFSNTNPELSRL